MVHSSSIAKPYLARRGGDVEHPAPATGQSLRDPYGRHRQYTSFPYGHRLHLVIRAIETDARPRNLAMPDLILVAAGVAFFALAAAYAFACDRL
ncbi:hypothetical protein STHU_15650 [Allostella humosa]|nr:hypothetical protein STHU_15650 [Stella humosa]